MHRRCTTVQHAHRQTQRHTDTKTKHAHKTTIRRQELKEREQKQIVFIEENKSSSSKVVNGLDLSQTSARGRLVAEYYCPYGGQRPEHLQGQCALDAERKMIHDADTRDIDLAFAKIHVQESWHPRRGAVVCQQIPWGPNAMGHRCTRRQQKLRHERCCDGEVHGPRWDARSC